MAEEADVSGAALQLLLENHRAFLRFLERKVGDRAAAEDILQEAFTRNLDRLESVGEQAIVPWFYKTLRNAAIDYHRRRGAAGRAIDAFAKQLVAEEAPSPEMAAEICACVSRLAGTIKPEYAAVLHSVDVDGVPVKEFAARNQWSPNNAGVRIFRAREALRKRVIQSYGTCAEHRCLDCTCQR